MKVIFIISSFRPLIGGAERATERLASILLSKGVDLLILTRYHRKFLRYEKIKGIPIYRLGLDLPRPFGPLSFIIHVLLWLAFNGQSYPIIHVQNIDSPLLVGMLAKLLLGKSLIITIHGEKNIIFKKRDLFGKLRVTLMSCLGDRFVAISEETRKQYLREDISHDRVISIPNGIDTNYFIPPTLSKKISLRQELSYPSEGIIFLYVGRLVALKRLDMLINIWSGIKYSNSSYLLLVGDGPDRRRLQILAGSRGVADRVHFVGATDNVLPYYQMADIFVLPSLYEGLSVALLEAMACGLCVIVSGSPGNLSLIQDGINGLVFPVDKPELLSKCLTMAVADPELRRRLGQIARRTVEKTYAIDVVASKHLRMYKELLTYA